MPDSSGVTFHAVGDEEDYEIVERSRPGPKRKQEISIAALSKRQRQDEKKAKIGASREKLAEIKESCSTIGGFLKGMQRTKRIR